MVYQSAQKLPTEDKGLGPVVFIWLFISAALAYEYIALNRIISLPSFLHFLKNHGLIPKSTKLVTNPGDDISYILGIIGFMIICLTNIYIFKKKRQHTKPTGSLKSWLNYHILFGLLGPTIIVFHSDFKVRGLVAISFWSMIVCFVSGIIGRYFYVQLLKERRDMKSVVHKYEKTFEAIRLGLGQSFDKRTLEEAKWTVFVHVGGSAELQAGKTNLLGVLFDSVRGDLNRLFMKARLHKNLPKSLYRPLIDYALAKRRYYSSDHYKMLMGYWHTFHLPFAVFMYVVTVIHIVVAVTMRVN